MDVQTKSKQSYINQPTERISGAEAVIRCLIAEGVDTIYGYPGGAIMPVYDELLSIKIKYIMSLQGTNRVQLMLLKVLQEYQAE